MSLTNQEIFILLLSIGCVVMAATTIIKQSIGTLNEAQTAEGMGFYYARKRIFTISN